MNLFHLIANRYSSVGEVDLLSGCLRELPCHLSARIVIFHFFPKRLVVDHMLHNFLRGFLSMIGVILSLFCLDKQISQIVRRELIILPKVKLLAHKTQHNGIA